MTRSFGARLLRGAALLALVDGIWAIVLTMAYGRPPMSVWNGVASAAFGAEMLEAGWKGVAIGLAMHVTTATWWTLVWVTAESNIKPLQKWTSSTAGMLLVAVIYGPIIWICMSGLVIPTMTGRALTVTGRWFIQLAGHAVFVGPPVLFGARRT